MHAKRMTDCTYLAQAQMEQLHALPWTSSSTPSLKLVDAGVDSTSPWACTLSIRIAGSQPPARSSGGWSNHELCFWTTCELYYVSWDIEVMDTSSTRNSKMMVRCQYLRSGHSISGTVPRFLLFVFGIPKS